MPEVYNAGKGDHSCYHFVSVVSASGVLAFLSLFLLFPLLPPFLSPSLINLRTTDVIWGDHDYVIMILSSLTMFISPFIHGLTYCGWRHRGKLRTEVPLKVPLLVLGSRL